MNKTISSLIYFNKYRTIPILNGIQSQSTDNENKYNYSNHLNQIESIKSSIYTNSYLQTDNTINAKLIHKNIKNLKNLSVKRRKIYNNNFNILKFNNAVCNTINNNFTGKKILLSKYSLLNRNKISENTKIKNNIKNLFYNKEKENKNIEINSTFFDEKFKRNLLTNSNVNKGEYLSTKIENELNKILNKTKINNSKDGHKNNKKNKSLNLLINNTSESKLKENPNPLLLKETKINDELRKNNLKKINKKDLYNQYLNSNLIKRKVLFIDKYNNAISKDNTLNLLNEEKDILSDNLYSYLIPKEDNGNEVSLPLLQRYNKAYGQNSKFVTQLKDKLVEENNNPQEKKQSGSLGKLIKDKFSKQNYQAMKITGKASEFSYYNKNLTNRENKLSELMNNMNKNSHENTGKERRKRNKNNNTNALNDILGVIKAKTITSKKKKKKSKSPNKSPKKEKEKNKKKKQLVKTLSQIDIISSVYRISKKYFDDKDKNYNFLINYPFIVTDSKGRKIKITFIRKGNKLYPINEKGEEEKDPRILKDLYEQVKIKRNSEEEKKLFPKKRLSQFQTIKYENPIKIMSDEDEDKEHEITNSNKKDIDKNDNDNLNKSLKDETKKEEVIKLSKIKKDNLPIGKTKSPKRANISLIKKKPTEDKKPIQIKEPIKKEVKETKQDEFLYKEEDDFIKDFDFDFESSEEESDTVSLQKLIRQIRKRKNKYLFLIFEYISKNSDIENNFKKEDLIKYLIDKDFRNNFKLLKENIIKLRELVRDSLDPEGKDKKKRMYIKDMDIINYIYRYIKDKNSLFYKSIYKRIKKQKEEKKNNSGDYGKLVQMLSNTMGEDKKKRQFSLYSRRNRDYAEDKSSNMRKSQKKFVKKKRLQSDETITQLEKKMLLLNEINLTNEIRYQISISNDKESKEKFKNLLNKIESLRNLTGDDYVKSLKKNFTMFKEEAEEILKAKEIEERVNGFIDDLNYQRNNIKDKRRIITSLIYIKDNKFLSSFENEVIQ